MTERPTIGMLDPRGQVVKECQDGNIPKKSIALTYAFAIRQESRADFTAANAAIRARFATAKDPDGSKALIWIKELAWAYVEGRKSP